MFKAYTVLETLKNTKTGGRGESEVTLFNGDRVSVRKDDNVLGEGGGNGCTTM